MMHFTQAEPYRYQGGGKMSSEAGQPHGLFQIPGRYAKGRALRIIACDASEPEAKGWEHVSVSLPDSPHKCPSWEEMCLVKALFWEPEDCVVQFHPPESDYVNNHPGCLHLWRYALGFPQPPVDLVGIQKPRAGLGLLLAMGLAAKC